MTADLEEGFDYFYHQADMGVIGRGKTLEAAFIQAAMRFLLFCRIYHR